jgi:hypothetical protein
MDENETLKAMEVKTAKIKGKSVIVQSLLKHNKALPSKWISLDDPDFLLKFAEIWDQHVNGFKKPKREKTEKELNMEWRKRAQQRKAETEGKVSKTEKSNLANVAQLAYSQLKSKRKAEEVNSYKANAIAEVSRGTKKVKLTATSSSSPTLIRSVVLGAVIDAKLNGEGDDDEQIDMIVQTKPKISRAQRKAMKKQKGKD